MWTLYRKRITNNNKIVARHLMCEFGTNKNTCASLSVKIEGGAHIAAAAGRWAGAGEKLQNKGEKITSGELKRNQN
jgi:hypothetical protein